MAGRSLPVRLESGPERKRIQEERPVGNRRGDLFGRGGRNERPRVSGSSGTAGAAAVGADSRQSENAFEHQFKRLGRNACRLPRGGAIASVGGSGCRTFVGRNGYGNDSAAVHTFALTLIFKIVKQVLQVLFYPQIVH